MSRIVGYVGAGSMPSQSVVSATAVAPSDWVWTPRPKSDSYTFQPRTDPNQVGGYGLLLSLWNKNSTQEAQDYAKKQGVVLTYWWEQGQPTRDRYPVDKWLAQLPPDDASNERWVYGEGFIPVGGQPLVADRHSIPLVLYVTPIQAFDITATQNQGQNPPKQLPPTQDISAGSSGMPWWGWALGLGAAGGAGYWAWRKGWLRKLVGK